MSFMIVTHLQTRSPEAREKAISSLRTAIEYSLEHEPGVKKYCITIPQKDDETTIYILEQYADKTSFDARPETPSNLWKQNPELLSAPIKSHNLPSAFSYTRPTIDEHKDPYIVFGTLTYVPGTAEAAIADFTRVGEFSDVNEEGTLSYTVLRDGEDENVVRTVEVYASEEVLWDPHAKSEVVLGNMRRQGDSRIGRDLVFLKRVAGYLYR